MSIHVVQAIHSLMSVHVVKTIHSVMSIHVVQTIHSVMSIHVVHCTNNTFICPFIFKDARIYYAIKNVQ